MILLAKVFLPVVAGVAPPVTPFKDLLGRHVDILEELVTTVAAVSARSGDGERASAAAVGPGVRQGQAHQAGE